MGSEVMRKKRRIGRELLEEEEEEGEVSLEFKGSRVKGLGCMVKNNF